MTAPTVTPAKKVRFLEALERHAGDIEIAAKNARASKQAFYRERKKDSEFAAAWDKAHEIGIERAVDIAENTLMKRVKYEADHPTGKLTATIFTLKTKGRSRGYNELREVTHNFSLSDVLKEIDDDRSRRVQAPRLEVAKGSG